MLTDGTSTGRNRNIELLRAFAILFVLCYHFTWMRPVLPARGYPPVVSTVAPTVPRFASAR